jgi:hypothetical protein
VHVETRSTSFLVEPQNQGRRFVSGLDSKPLEWFSSIWPQNRWLKFSGLSLKTGRSSLVIWDSKSPRRFLGLGLKTKQVSVFQLRHKTDGGRAAQDTHRDLMACFAWKQVTLGFFSLASRLEEARRWVVHVARSRMLCQNQVKDGRVDAMGYVGPGYSYFAVFYVLDPIGIVVF